MSECRRCEGKRTIATTSGSISIIQPCPECNALNDGQKNKDYLNEIFNCIEVVEKLNVK